MAKLALNLKEASEAVGVSEPTMRALVALENFPALRVGRRWLIPVDAFNAWLVEQARARTCLAEGKE